MSIFCSMDELTPSISVALLIFTTIVFSASLFVVKSLIKIASISVYFPQQQ